MPKAKKAKAVKKSPKKAEYKLSITTGGETVKIEGDDLVEALTSFKPAIIKTKTVITAEHNGKKIEKSLAVFQARRTFANPYAAELLAKQIRIALNAV